MNRIRVSLLGAAVWTVIAAASAMAQTDFSGTWEFSAAKSKNVGMMAQMKLTATVKQTKAELIVTNVSNFNGQEQTAETKFDLTGKPVPNKNPMEAVAETVTKWDGKKLVTTWTSPGSVEGSTSVRTETRSLSDAGRTLTVESVRGKTPPIVMVYDKK
jgi:hypothetical protein